MLDSTVGIAAEISQVREDRLKELARAETELRAAEDEAAARKAAAERAAQALARYVEPGRSGANPPRLLRYMLEDNPDARALEREVGMISRTRRLFQALDKIVRQELRSRNDPDVPEQFDQELARQSSPPGSEAPAEVDEIQATIHEMTLDAHEIEILASPALAGIAPQEPRSVKRMINTYRVVRGRLDPAQRRALLGDQGAPPAYPVVAILLALECGPASDGMHAGLAAIYRPSAPESVGANLDEDWRRLRLRSPPRRNSLGAPGAIGPESRLGPRSSTAFPSALRRKAKARAEGKTIQ